jgi:hypothetical protein
MEGRLTDNNYLVIILLESTVLCIVYSDINTNESGGKIAADDQGGKALKAAK